MRPRNGRRNQCGLSSWETDGVCSVKQCTQQQAFPANCSLLICQVWRVIPTTETMIRLQCNKMEILTRDMQCTCIILSPLLHRNVSPLFLGGIEHFALGHSCNESILYSVNKHLRGLPAKGMQNFGPSTPPPSSSLFTSIPVPMVGVRPSNMQGWPLL